MGTWYTISAFQHVCVTGLLPHNEVAFLVDRPDAHNKFRLLLEPPSSTICICC